MSNYVIIKLSLKTDKIGRVYVASSLYTDLRHGTNLYLINRACISYIQLRSNINTPNFIFS